MVLPACDSFRSEKQGRESIGVGVGIAIGVELLKTDSDADSDPRPRKLTRSHRIFNPASLGRIEDSAKRSRRPG
ncbi:MAG: hypothetical protein JXR49_17955 [Acidobacteria bacterium]|nr:hypothetical protein [Acidobacteriota bacterium]